MDASGHRRSDRTGLRRGAIGRRLENRKNLKNAQNDDTSRIIKLRFYWHFYAQASRIYIYIYKIYASIFISAYICIYRNVCIGVCMYIIYISVAGLAPRRGIFRVRSISRTLFPALRPSLPRFDDARRLESARLSSDYVRKLP